MDIYIDISQLDRGRANTGIQRVLTQFLRRAMQASKRSETPAINYHILSYNSSINSFELLDNSEILPFLDNLKNYQFSNKQSIDLNSPIASSASTVFFDLDSAWNAPIKRAELYPQLKQNGYLIFNFIYDLIPLVHPQYAQRETVKNFSLYIQALCCHSDLIFFDSRSANDDFLSQQKNVIAQQKIPARDIPTRVIALGADFVKSTRQISDPKIKALLQTKYILFVATIEPRKLQAQLLTAFEHIARQNSQLKLIFIGKQGWQVEAFIQQLQQHPLKEQQLYWLNDIDDDTLSHFYQQAWLVCYLSAYEGYGLPIAESLQYGNITLTSNNSSMYEVGRDFADYIDYGANNELIDIISLYQQNQPLYQAKKAHIKQHYQSPSWGDFYSTLDTIFRRFQYSKKLRQQLQNSAPQRLQFVFISIDIEALIGTIKAIEQYIDFVKHYVIITRPQLLAIFKQRLQQLSPSKAYSLIDETSLLSPQQQSDFATKDHQSKNWLLRASLVNLPLLDAQFIMLDDDNRPLKPISIDSFINPNGCYQGYYFYRLLHWHNQQSAFDLGQQQTSQVLSIKNYELLSYASHCPQIIDKEIFSQAIAEFFQMGLTTAIDEWSIYFNYACSNYPYVFCKQVFRTLNWPQNPLNWDYDYQPQNICFENYYASSYNNGLFNKKSSSQEKIQLKQQQLEPFLKTRQIFQQNQALLVANNNVYGSCQFHLNEVQLYLANLPKTLLVTPDADFKLNIHYQLFNPRAINLSAWQVDLVLLYKGKIRTISRFNALKQAIYQQAMLELPFLSLNLAPGSYSLALDLRINGRYSYKKSPYVCQLVVNSHNVFSKQLQQLQQQSLQQSQQQNMSKQKNTAVKSLKAKLKQLPFLGWLLRWGYNHLRLNNLKQAIFVNRDNINELQRQLQQQQQQIHLQQQQYQQQHNENTRNQQQQQQQQQQQLQQLQQQHAQQIQRLEENIELQIKKQLHSQALLFEQKIQHFIDQLQTTATTESQKQPLAEKLQQQNHHDAMDDYYLAFEETFRGSQELILKRYHAYLKYLSPEINTALDIGCGRGEWVGLLQQNSMAAQGIDLNQAMLSAGTAKGVKNLQHIDAFDFFAHCPDNSFDLITAFHIIEHIPFEQLFVFLKQLKRIAKPNATLLLETPNPANILVAAYTFYKDPTHLNPLPAEVVSFLLQYLGFKDIQTHFLHPLDKAQQVPSQSPLAQRFNSYFYREQDYLLQAKNAKAWQPQSISKNHSKQKLKLAYFSPMPPEKTGIADYSEQLLPYLSAYYDIEVIVDNDKPNSSENSAYKQRSLAWFNANSHYFQRVIYHIGNSAYHHYMLAALEQVPGLVVLHDFYLSSLMEKSQRLNPEFIYHSHGYAALQYFQATNIAELAWRYPCNKQLLQQAKSIIVHSNYAKQLAQQWYSHISPAWEQIPLLRIPVASTAAVDKQAIKHVLQLPGDAFVVCSFGMLGKSKKNQQLVDAWLNSNLSQAANSYLIFVGETSTSDYTKKLNHSIENQPNIIITGWNSPTQFKHYLSIADIAVQLRSLSRGETSAALLDCLNYAIATISNAHGSATELPKNIFWRLEDNFSTKALSQALQTLYQHRQQRQQLAQQAQQYMAQQHQPQQCAKAYQQAIEAAYQPASKSTTLATDLQALDVSSMALSHFNKVSQKQILIDISAIIKEDLKTGIQRVVRSQIIALIENAPANYRIEPVYLGEDLEQQPCYFYARRYTQQLLKLKNTNLYDQPVYSNAADIFYGLDLNAKEVAIGIKSGLYQRYKNLGVKCYFVIYDLLPILQPQFFPSQSQLGHQQWLENISRVADTLICISNSVAGEVKQWLQQYQPQKATAINVSTLHLGADILHQKQPQVAEKTSIKTSKQVLQFLMVGTIEPRKGHAQTLAAFELLWQQNAALKLTIVGKTGWMVEDFIQKLSHHPEQGKRLFYKQGINDQQLSELYANSDCLILASEAEGFGLPLIEAAQHQLPIIARELAVFKEVASDYAYYFANSAEPQVLAQAIQDWLLLYQQNQHPQSKNMPYLSWQQNAQQLVKLFSQQD